MLKVLQTPDSRFEGLVDWPFEPIYTMVDATSASDAVTLRVHHIDTGPIDAAETVLCMHGEPSWSYLWLLVIA